MKGKQDDGVICTCEPAPHPHSFATCFPSAIASWSASPTCCSLPPIPRWSVRPFVRSFVRVVQLNNMSSMEMNTIRTFYCTALSRFQRLHQASEGDANAMPAASQQEVDGDASMPQASQRRLGGSSAPSGPSAASQQQLGAQTQQAQEGLEQARKLRRFG